MEMKLPKNRKENKLMKKRIFAITMIIVFGCLPMGCGKTEADKTVLLSSESVLSDDETEKNHENVEEVEKGTDIELTDIRWDEEKSVYEVEYIDLDGATQSGSMDFEGNIDTTKEDDYQGEGIVLDCYRGRFLVEIEHSSIDELYYEVAVCDETGFVLASTTVESQPMPGEHGHINENMFWFKVFESNYYSESGLRDTYLLDTELYDPIYLGCGVNNLRMENEKLFFEYHTQYGYDSISAMITFSGSGFSWDEYEFYNVDDYIGAVSSGYFLQKRDSLYKYDWEGNEVWCFDQYPIRVLDVSEAGIGCALSGKDGKTYVTCLDIETGEMKYGPIQTVDTTAIDVSDSFTYNDTYSYKQYYTWNEKQEDNDKFIHYSLDLLTGEIVYEIETQDAFLSEDCMGGIFLFSDTDLSDLYNFAGEKIIPKVLEFKNSY